MILGRIFVLISALVIFSLFTVNGSLLAEGRNTVDKLYDKAWSLQYINADSAIFYANLQEKVAKKLDYTIGVVNAYYVRGNIYSEQRQFDLASIEYHEGLSTIKGRKDSIYIRKKALILQGLGLSYELTYGYNLAISYYNEALEAALSISYDKCIADLNYNLGICYSKINKKEEAFYHYNTALEFYKKDRRFEDVADTYNVLGIYYKTEEQYSLAEEYYKKAISLSRKHNTSIEKKSWFINNIGEIHFVQNQYQEAEKYYAEALKIAQEFDDKEKVKLFTNNLGDVYLKQKNYPEAIAYYQMSIALGNGDDRIDEEMKRAYKQLAVAYEATEQYKSALDYTHRFMDQVALLEETKDKLMVQNAQYRMKEVEWQRQLADKETLLAQLKSWLNSGLAVFALFLIVFGYISRRLYLHYTVHKEMKRILMTPISEELERLERKNKGWDNDDRD